MMDAFWLAVGPVFMFSAIALTDDAKDKAIKDELAALQGKWKVVAVEGDGKPIDKIEKPTFTFMDGKMSGFGPEMTFTIDPTQKPKHITMVAKERQITVNSIYSLEKDELKIAIPLVEKGKGPENKRP